MKLYYYNDWEIEKHYHEYGGLEYYCIWLDDNDCKKFDYLDDAYEFIDNYYG